MPKLSGRRPTTKALRSEPNSGGPVVLDSWLFFSPMSQARPKAERVGEIAAKVVVQLLFATGRSFTVDGLREKLREFYREEIRPELCAVAALNNVELIPHSFPATGSSALSAFSCGFSMGWFRS